MISKGAGDTIFCCGQLLNSDEATIKHAPNAGSEAIEPGKFIAEYPNGGVGLPNELYQKIIGCAIDSVPARAAGYLPGQQCYFVSKGEVALRLLTTIVPNLPVGVLRVTKGILKPGDLATSAQYDVASPLPSGAVTVRQYQAIGHTVPASINFPE